MWKYPNSVGLTCGRLVLEASVQALRNNKTQGWCILFKHQSFFSDELVPPLWAIGPTANNKTPQKPWAKCLSFPCLVLSLYHQARPGPQDVPACASVSASRESRCQGSVRESVIGSPSLGPQSIRAHLENRKQKAQRNAPPS